MQKISKKNDEQESLDTLSSSGPNNYIPIFVAPNNNNNNRQQKDYSLVPLKKNIAISAIDHRPDFHKDDVDDGSESIEAKTILSTSSPSLSKSTQLFIFIGLQIALLLTAMDR